MPPPHPKPTPPSHRGGEHNAFCSLIDTEQESSVHTQWRGTHLSLCICVGVCVSMYKSTFMCVCMVVCVEDVCVCVEVCIYMCVWKCAYEFVVMFVCLYKSILICVCTW